MNGQKTYYAIHHFREWSGGEIEGNALYGTEAEALAEIDALVSALRRDFVDEIAAREQCDEETAENLADVEVVVGSAPGSKTISFNGSKHVFNVVPLRVAGSAPCDFPKSPLAERRKI